ncbi:PaaI family thioesterase [Gynuella sunshinyii]|uniref:Uncharacterized protein, possibly involved in aromatic compounds catabolism n=1 Tax=Gynuella sunshinyii YC6258 TaxID=1445510 RepID=A0A0C5VAB0_9GAMM|nr:PaaI family thioesterase [Gynuella sunshinyii]AJQ96240.1 uncharacterized protein, possibly involved in aromatic compounds catabolism [Gynuella sunshinyii YC6258]
MQKADDHRNRTFTWEDPAQSAQKASQMSGLEYLSAISREEIPMPPVMKLLGVEVLLVNENGVSLEFVPKEYHYNTIGGVHGGIYSTLLDSVISCAVHATLEKGIGYSTIDLKVNFIRPMTIETGLVSCLGNVVNSGRRLAFAEGKIIDQANKLLATATGTCMIHR